MTTPAVVLLLLLVGGIVGAASVWAAVTCRGEQPTNERDTDKQLPGPIPPPPPAPVKTAILEATSPTKPAHSSGATIPWSDEDWDPSEDSIHPVPVRDEAGSLVIGDDLPGTLGPMLVVTTKLTGSEVALPDPDGLPVIAGSFARALEAVAGNTRLMDWIINKGGLAVVEMPAGTKWMTAHGRKVAQAIGDGGQAGPRAAILAGGAAAAVAPQLIGIAAAFSAEYVLNANIERTRQITALIHQRQVNEVLAVGDIGRAHVEYARAFSENPRELPEILIQELVAVSGNLGFQIQTSQRMRRSVLGDIDSEDAKQPKNPEIGDKNEAALELIAGYELPVSAAKVAAVRIEHAVAHGDVKTVEHLVSQLGDHLDALQEHHDEVRSLMTLRHRRLGQKWVATVESLVESYGPMVEQLNATRRFMLSLSEAGDLELRALPPRTTPSPAKSAASQRV